VVARSRNSAVYNQIGECNRKGTNPDRNIAGENIARAYHNLPVAQIVTACLNQYSMGERIEVLNSQNQYERFGIVTYQREGHVYFTFEITGRRTYRAIGNGRSARHQRCQTRTCTNIN